MVASGDDIEAVCKIVTGNLVEVDVPPSPFPTRGKVGLILLVN